MIPRKRLTIKDFRLAERNCIAQSESGHTKPLKAKEVRNFVNAVNSGHPSAYYKYKMHDILIGGGFLNASNAYYGQVRANESTGKHKDFKVNKGCKCNDCVWAVITWDPYCVGYSGIHYECLIKKCDLCMESCEHLTVIKGRVVSKPSQCGKKKCDKEVGDSLKVLVSHWTHWPHDDRKGFFYTSETGDEVLNESGLNGFIIDWANYHKYK